MEQLKSDVDEVVNSSSPGNVESMNSWKVKVTEKWTQTCKEATELHTKFHSSVTNLAQLKGNGFFTNSESLDFL